MSSITIKAGLDSSGFRAGLDTLKGEARNFRETFQKGIEQGGGLFGSLDKAFGKLATGRLATPIAAIGAALTVARVATDAMSKSWENMASSTERALQNIQAIEATREAVASQRYAGESANRFEAIRQAGIASAAGSAQQAAGEIGDPSTIRGLIKTANTLAGKEGPSATGFYHFLMLAGGRMGIPGMGAGYEAANELYNQRQQRAQETRQQASQAEQLRPYVEFANRSAQRSAQGGLISSEDRLNVAQGRTTAYEAAANKLLVANAQYQDTLKTFGENDPRTLQAKSAALDAFTDYDTSLTQARKFRNDPTIIADSLARLGGGGNVGVFGQGQGELLFEQKRLNQSMSGLTQAVVALNASFSRAATLGNDVQQ